MALPIFRPTARAPRRASEYFGCIHLQHWLSHLSARTFLSFSLLKDRKNEENESKTFHKKCFLLYMYPSWQGHPTSIFGKYLFGRRFEIYNFRNICCKISCLPASPRIFDHLKPGITALFKGFLLWKGHLEFSIAFFLAENFEKVSFDAYNFRITRLSARKSKQMKNF